MRAKILHTLKNAIVTLSRFPNPHTNDGAKRQALVGEFTRLVNEIEAEKTETRYEARVARPNGKWEILYDENQLEVVGSDYDTVLADATRVTKDCPMGKGYHLVMARITVTYISPA